MSPEQLIANLTAFLNGLMPALGVLAGIIGTVVYGIGKGTDQPHMTLWGKNAWLGAFILFGGAAIVGLARFIAGQVFGSVA